MSAITLLVILLGFSSITPKIPAEELAVMGTDSAKISVFGDIVIHDRINEQALTADGSYDFAPLFDGTREVLANSDYGICTLETTFPDVAEFTGYPMFKTSGDLATGLKEVGFDMVNTASNHAMDGFEDGLYRTLDILDENNLDHVGTYRSQAEKDANNGILVKEINGISIAFLSYTYGTNGMDIDNFNYAVNLMYTDYKNLPPQTFDYATMSADLASARALNTDFIAVQLHWGYEYVLEPIPHQVELADFMFEQGVDIILGGHPHVPQPMELREVVDLNGNKKTGFIVYSIGNLLANMDDDYKILSSCIDITLEKDRSTNEAYIKHISYRPLLIVDTVDYGVTDAEWELKLCDTRAMISAYESGVTDNMNEQLYTALKSSIDDLHTVHDPIFDEINGGVDVTTWTPTT